MIYEVDNSKFAVEDPVLLPDELPGGVGEQASTDTEPSVAADAFVHDLLVVYTPASSLRYGQAALESKILAAVAAANQAYLNSNVNITLNLVGLQEVDYTESSGLSESLSYLQQPVGRQAGRGPRHCAICWVPTSFHSSARIPAAASPS